jgi:hypothetical protein
MASDKTQFGASSSTGNLTLSRNRGGAGDDTMVGGAGNDEMFGDETGSVGNDFLDSRDDVENNDSLDGGDGTDTCSSDPDPEENCES